MPSLSLPVSLHADHFRQHHRIGLAEHRGLRLDAADAPAEHREAVDHGGVRVGADQRVRIGDLGGDGLPSTLTLSLRGPDRLRQIFEIDLMADAGAGRHDAEILERVLRPFQELVALLVLLVFLLDVLLERVLVAEEIDRHRMVDDEIDRHQRIDLLRIAAEMLHGVAHGGEIDHRRHAGEVLHQHARRAERDLAVRGLGLEPLRDGLDVLLGDGAAVLVAQQVLQQHLHRERQPRNALEAVLFGDRQAVIGVGLGADLERPAALETVERGHDCFPFPPAGCRGKVEVIYCQNRAPTERWRSGAGGVAGTAQPSLRLIRSFSELCQISNKWSIKCPAARRCSRYQAGSAPRLRTLLMRLAASIWPASAAAARSSRAWALRSPPARPCWSPAATAPANPRCCA